MSGLVAGIAGPAEAAVPRAAPLSDAPSGPDVPSALPAGVTPDVNDGAVLAIAQVGNQIVLGGSFTSVTPRGGSPVARQYLVAFDATTGVLSSTFAPEPSAQVRTLVAGPDGTVFVGGDFGQVDGTPAAHIARLRVADGQPFPGFTATNNNGRVNDLELFGSRLLAGGAFSSAGGAPHAGFAAFDLTTGQLEPWFDLQIAEHHNQAAGGAVGPVRVDDLSITPDGTRMVAIGNFKKVDGLVRDQIVMVDLAYPNATVAPNWSTNAYAPLCNYKRHDSYVRKVDIAPDGSYFVVTSTGGYSFESLCDAVARFEIDATGLDIVETWELESGSDTMWGLEVTSDVIFVGGHQRWLNNSGRNVAGPGAVPRPGLAALDPTTGLPLAWNPGRNPRGVALYAMLATPDGLWIGSDTEWIGDFEYQRERVAFFPYAGGTDVASTSIANLPADIYAVRADGSLWRTRFDGTAATPFVQVEASGWKRTRGGVVVGGSLYTGRTNEMLYARPTLPGGFGSTAAVNPYDDPRWAGVPTGSGQTYLGFPPDLYDQLDRVTSLAYDDGRLYYTLRGKSSLYWRSFVPDSGVIGFSATALTGGRDWSATSGMFIAGGYLYAVDPTQQSLIRLTMGSNGPTGAPVVVNGPATGGITWDTQTIFARAT